MTEQRGNPSETLLELLRYIRDLQEENEFMKKLFLEILERLDKLEEKEGEK